MKKNLFLSFTVFFVVSCLHLFAQDISITHGPYLQALGENEVTIVWTTNADAASWVEIAPAGSNSFYAGEHPKYFETLNGKRVVGKLHRVRISGLNADTEYRYRIFSREVLTYEGHRLLYGNIASSNVYSQRPLRFRTLNPGAEEINFSVINDIHGKSDTLKALLAHVKYGETGLVFFNGDMVSSMDNEQQVLGGFMDQAAEMFAGSVPVYFARGNHEARGPFSARFPDYFPTKTGKPYYAFRQGPVFFVVLDCGEDKPDSDIEYSELARFDDYRSEQAVWLGDIVKTAEFNNAPYRIVILHIPPYGSDWHGAQDLRRKFVPLLNKSGITAMFSGHTHRYGYFPPTPGENSFPVLINANTTSLEVKADNKTMTVINRNSRGQELHRHVYHPVK
jgi:acid phosphatase type 7